MIRFNTAKLAVILGFLIVCLLSIGATIKTAISANKPPKIQSVRIENYAEILEAVETEKKELLDSIKNEIKTLKNENEQLLAKVNTRPKTIVVRERQIETQTNQTNQIIVSERYTPQTIILQKKSGNLEILE